jgi:hypothetical protein
VVEPRIAFATPVPLYPTSSHPILTGVTNLLSKCGRQIQSRIETTA